MAQQRVNESIVTALKEAKESVDESESAVTEIGEHRLHQLADTYDEFIALLNQYEDRATGSGEFGSYVEFQGRLADFIDDLSADTPNQETFETAADILHRRRLAEKDFQQARNALSPVENLLDRLAEREAAHDQYHDVRSTLVEHHQEIESRIEHLESLMEYTSIDFDAPVDELRAPIQSYNAAVSDEFDSFLTTATASDVLAFIQTTTAFPLIEFPSPPDDLKEYINSHSAGTESINTLKTYAEYPESKLAHYIDDPRSFKARVAVHQTYFDKLSADPLRVNWPPPPALVLQWQGRELVSVLNRFADSRAIEKLKTVVQLTYNDDWFARLRGVAVANDQLTAADRERLTNGNITDDLAEATDALDRVTRILEQYPPLNQH